MGEVDLAWQLPAREHTTPDGWLVREFAVCIRWEPNPNSSQGRSRPFIYCNAAHVARGISAVRALESVSIQRDETFTANGLAFGPSMSSEASIQIARNGAAMRADDPLLASLSLGNIWFAATSTTPPAPAPPTGA